MKETHSTVKRYQAAKSSIKLCKEIYKKVKKLNKCSKGKKQEKRKRYQAVKSSIKSCWEISRNVKKLNEAKELMQTGKAPAAARGRQGPPAT